jgi:pSer/pThr/pTyr-binding forkhead associated (FHA) protein
VLRGTTGTQVNKERIEEKQYNKKIEIQLGDRVILGGKVRMKLVAKG